MTDSINDPSTSVAEMLSKSSKTNKGFGKLWWILALLIISIAAYFWFFTEHAGASGKKAVTYVTQPASRAAMSVSIMATGNLEPLNAVDIGTELSGTISEVLVDANDHVTKGQILAKLNTDDLQDTITKSRAALSSAQSTVTQARAKISQAEADIKQSQATLQKSRASILQAQASQSQANASVMQAKTTTAEAWANYNRLQQLYQRSGGKIPSRSDLDTAKATWERAKASETSSSASVNSAMASVSSANADLAGVRANEASLAAAKLSAQAALQAAQASVIQAQATLNTAETSLSKAIIKSPIDGVILERSIEPGQTVASSLSAPTLFTIAEDLSKMELQVSVDEADVGQVKEGQHATFTVDAWPGRNYEGTITRVSLSADTSQSVISYLTMLSVENQDLSLRLDMTATANIETQSRSNALRVPNTALRFTPADLPEGATRDAESGAGEGGQRAEGERGGGQRGGQAGGNEASAGSSFLSKLMPAPRVRGGGNNNRSRRNNAAPREASSTRKVVWVLEDGAPRRIRVETGISDGKFTEIVSGNLEEGMEVITQSIGSD